MGLSGWNGSPSLRQVGSTPEGQSRDLCLSPSGASDIARTTWGLGRARGSLPGDMELWGGMLWALLSGPGRRGGTRGRAFSSWRPHRPQAGLSATELVSQWTAVFEKRGIPEARESSEYIVAHVLGAQTFQSLRPGLRSKPLTPGQLQCVQELSSRRLQRMPVQYILGEWDFCGLNLKMAPPVFIPRPETEELVEWVLEEVAQKSRAVGAQGGPLILEVGCGSGAISLSLLSQLPQSRVIAVDKAGAAISLARENAQRLQLQDRIRIAPLDVTLEGNWAHLLPWGPMDLLVSNPPYVFHQDMEQLAPEIRSYEDPAALDGGEKGMDVIVHLLALAPRLLKDSGSLFLEVDPRHPELVSSWLQSRPGLSLELVAVRKDFCGRPRFLHIQRSGPHGGCPVDTWPAPQPAGVPG